MSASALKITVQSSDGETLAVEQDVIKLFSNIKILQPDLDPDWQSEPILMQKVNAATLNKVIEWCRYHKDDVPPTEEDEKKEKETDDIPPWDSEFLQVDQMTLFELIVAANYLGIKALLAVTCKAFGKKIEGKTPKEVRQLLNINNDFAKEEKSAVDMEKLVG